MTKVAVVTTTYNEKDSLPILVEKVFSLKIPNLKMVVVDDNSPDGTGELARKLAKKYPLQVIHRSQKLGAGSAYVWAFKKLLNSKDAETKPDYIIQMDADLSHEPENIPQFLEKIRDCDVVIGSRYTDGGRTEIENTLKHLASRLGNLYARLVLRLPYRDITGGYKCYRREVLESLPLNVLNPIGYLYQMETIYYAHRLGFKISELPIFFKARKRGVSKLTPAIVVKGFLKVLSLRFGKFHK